MLASPEAATTEPAQSQGLNVQPHTADLWPSAILSLLENFLLPLWKTGVPVFMH